MTALAPGASALRPLDPPARPRYLPLWSWPVVALLVVVAGVVGVGLAPQGSRVAVWWPAAGIAVLFLVLTPPRRRWAGLLLVLGATALANAIGGRPPLAALCFGVANAAEALVVTALLARRGRPRFELRSLASAIYFCLAVIAGAVVVGLLAGATIAGLEDGAFRSTAAYVAASHAAAVVMIAPFALFPRRVPVRAGPLELALHVVALAAVIALVFRDGADLPLAFLPYPVLAWAAFRFPVRVVAVQTLLASCAILALTIAGGGPFNHEGLDLAVRAALAETFLVTFAGFSVVISAAQYELRDATRRLAATSRLLSGSLLEASVGLAIAQRRADGRVRVGWSNPTAAALVGEGADRSWQGPLADAADEALRSGDPVTVELDDRTLTVAANLVPDEPDHFSVQLVDVTEPLRMQAATLAAEQEQQAARVTRADLERQREDFVATTSHELRTPIASIVGYVELLEDSPGLTERERGWLEVVTRNADRLSALVEDLLAIGRIEADRDGVEPREIALGPFVTEVLGNVRVLADRKEMTLDVAGCSGTAYADPDDLTRMLTNLLANAVKFTPPHGRVTTRTVEHEDGTVGVVVSDTGPGMAPDELEHAFDRFYRAPVAERDAVPGTGLGLAIVSELAARNHGSVALVSPEGGGLVATLTLPGRAGAGVPETG
ncbi:ATP-binding protein [Janibacter sp. UYMM211]|uniref:sensor histidine kinase n=1 Tax=Janibacter sp. UYMM211 TaxID=3156342 RepID=UPI0033969A93